MSGSGGQAGARLGAVIDGVAVPEDAARELWRKFSEYMEAHKGDLGGFAKAEGFASVHPRSDGGRAMLVFSRTAVQEPYGAPAAPSAGQGGGRGGGGKKKRRR